MFQFPWCPLAALCVQAAVWWHAPPRVSPFGHRWLAGCTLLTSAFRSVPRPSSALDAQAFSVRSGSFSAAENLLLYRASSFFRVFPRYSSGNVPPVCPGCRSASLHRADNPHYPLGAVQHPLSPPETKTTRHLVGPRSLRLRSVCSLYVVRSNTADVFNKWRPSRLHFRW
jgi:hypothetical protein